MTQGNRSSLDGIKSVSVIDLILMDHQFLKMCIDVFLDDQAEKRKKLALSKDFLEFLHKHSSAEKKAIYSRLESNEELHFNILEAEIEHGIIDQKVRSIRPRVSQARVLKDEIEMELKVLAEVLQTHLREEESEILPKMRECLDQHTLGELGQSFMKLRKISPLEIMNHPHLQDELINWKDSVQKMSSQFLRKMDRYVEDLKH